MYTYIPRFYYDFNKKLGTSYDIPTSKYLPGGGRGTGVEVYSLLVELM